jgi:dipeptidase E
VTANRHGSSVIEFLGEQRFLLTSGGITNTSIHDALVELLGKPIAESNALCIPTAIYAFPGGVGKAGS